MDVGTPGVQRESHTKTRSLSISLVVPERGNVLKDQIIRLTGQTAEEKCPHLLRRVVFYDPVQDRTLVFLTNHMDLASTTIAAVSGMCTTPNWGVAKPFSSKTGAPARGHDPRFRIRTVVASAAARRTAGGAVSAPCNP
jgi:hypothetical protein